jgi:eukaryotic-like serine/threonine-protein kinase
MRPDDGRLTGQTLGGYRLGQVVGRGGMGEVYRAARTDTGDPVAVKVLRKSRVADHVEVKRFFREAELMKTVPSEHVARVFECGRFDEGSPFIAMELLEGHDLSWHLRRAPELPVDQVLELVEHAARALGAVHRAGVVHRDLKPGNLFLVDALPRAWKLVDFGVAEPSGAPAGGDNDELAGTPQYMAPEQVGGQMVDHRADIYSLATIAYRALAGRPPFLGELTAVLMAVMSAAPPPVSQFAKNLHPDMDLVFAIALAKDPQQRFPDAPSFGMALRGAAYGRLDSDLRARGQSLLAARRPAQEGRERQV